MDIPALIQPSEGSRPFSDFDITRLNAASMSLRSPRNALQPVGEGHPTASIAVACDWFGLKVTLGSLVFFTLGIQ